MTVLFQGVMILVAAGLVINAFWGNISNLWKNKVNTQSSNSQTTHRSCEHPSCGNLVDIVDCWSHLKECCESQGLTQATAELEKIFPLLIVKKTGAKDE